jgi:hypothetical protein
VWSFFEGDNQNVLSKFTQISRFSWDWNGIEIEAEARREIVNGCMDR